MLNTASQWKHKQQANLTFIPFIPIWDLVFNICRNWTRKWSLNPAEWVSDAFIHIYIQSDKASPEKGPAGTGGLAEALRRLSDYHWPWFRCGVGALGLKPRFHQLSPFQVRLQWLFSHFVEQKGWVIHRNASLSPMLAFCWGSTRAEAMLNNGDCQIICAGIIIVLSVPLLLNVSHAAFTDRTSLFDINNDWAADGQNRGQTDSEFEQRERFKGKSVRKHKQCRNMMDDVADASIAQAQVTPVWKVLDYSTTTTHLHLWVLPAAKTQSVCVGMCTNVVLYRNWWKCGFQLWKSLFFFQSLQTSPASVCHLSSYWPSSPVDHLGAGCDCTAMFIPPGWPDPIPAKTDMATASAAWTLSPLMVDPGLETEVGGEGPCWMTAAGEPVASAGTSREVSSPPAATDRDRNIHP